jgi:long-chain acyl-CoA synthetase
MSDLMNQLDFKQLYFRGIQFDKKEIETAIDHLSNHLIKNLRSPSPFVLFTAFNHIKTFIAYFAILKANRIAVILDPQLKSIEIEEIIQDIDPSAIIFLNESAISFNYTDEISIRNFSKGPEIKTDLTDVCTIAYTNAEDGFSKGAMLTRKNLLAEIEAVIRTNYLSSNSVMCSLLPFSHLYGFIHGILVPAFGKGSGLIPEINLLKISQTLNEIESAKVTHIHTVPSMYYILSKSPELVSCCKSIVDFYSGGIQLPSFIYDTFYKKTNRKIREGYGLTEGSPAVAGNYQEEGPVFGSFGKPFPGCEIEIRDENNLQCLPEQIGEICVKGDMIFKGYFNYEKTTHEVLKNQWLYTGDFGKKDKLGNIFFCGLKKKMINVAGNKVYPKKLERLINKYEKVISTTVFSGDSVLQGSSIGALVKLKDNSTKSQDELKIWCLNNINNTILPKSWVFE